MLILSEKYIMHGRRETYSRQYLWTSLGPLIMHITKGYSRKRRVPEFIVKWTESFLENRHTQLRFNGIDSDKIARNAGVPQGSPMSPILYLFYNADLPEIPGRRGQSLCFIDDIAYGVQCSTDDENAEVLKEMLEEAEEWSRRYRARFETSKYVLIHFTRNTHRKTTATIDIAGTTIAPAESARYLGVIFDKGLCFKQYIQHITKKATKFALAIARIANSTWGA